MKKSGILNGALLDAIACLGHTEYLVICDAGLPMPRGVRCIDLSLVQGKPPYADVLEAIAGELVLERYIYAGEMAAANPALLAKTRSTLAGLPCETVPHERFKQLCSRARCIVRTGEATSYANVILVGGVNF